MIQPQNTTGLALPAAQHETRIVKVRLRCHASRFLQSNALCAEEKEERRLRAEEYHTAGHASFQGALSRKVRPLSF